MSPVEDDPTVWAAIAKALRGIWGSLEFTHPFIGPAFIGAVLSATRKSYRKKGKVYWCSAVAWSTTAGCLLTPLFAHATGIPSDVAGSTAAFVAIMGHEALGFLARKFGTEEPWDGEERRASDRRGHGGDGIDPQPPRDGE